MKLKLSAKLYAATAGALMIMLVLAGVSVYSNKASQGALSEVFEHTVQPLLAVQAIDRHLQEIRFRVSAVTLGQMSVTGTRNHLKEAREAIPQQWNAFTSRNRSDTPEETELVKKIDAGLAALPQIFDKIDKAYAAEDRKALEVLMEEDWPPVTKQTVRPLAELIAIQAKQMGETYAASTGLSSRLSLTAISVFAAAVVVLLLGAVIVVRSIARPIRAVQSMLADVAQGDLTVRADALSSDEIGAMAGSVNTTVEALSQTLSGVRRAADRLSQSAASLSSEARQAREETGSQTDRVMEISAAMEELTVSVAEIAGRAKEVARASDETRAIARSSARAVGESTETTQRALKAVASSSDAVGQLSTEIEKISAITRVIKEIADQTNLLALNAAIEAARAGESGRGFAVVADEVRKLAERTTASTVDITQMIAAIQGKAASAVTAMTAVSVGVKQGAEQTGQLHQSFDRILGASEQLTQLAAEIADGTTAQTQVAQQTARSMEVISQIAERTGNSVDHVAAAAAETATTAKDLKALVDRFRVD